MVEEDAQSLSDCFIFMISYRNQWIFQVLRVAITIRYRDIAVHCKCQGELECQETVFNRMDGYPYKTIG